MNKFWTFLVVLFLLGVFLSVGGQPTDELGRTIGNGIEGGLDFLGSIWEAVTE